MSQEEEEGAILKEDANDNDVVHQSRALDNNQDSDHDSDQDIDRYWPPPTDDTIRLTSAYAGKTVSAFAFNNAGTRFATGSHDFEVRIYDFQSLDRLRPEPINNVQPSGQTIIKQLEFSPDDELILVVSGGCQAVIINKDGSSSKTNLNTPKGDQYITDMTNTKGHVQMLNDGSWNPKNNANFITCSNDATVRLWDLNNSIQQKTVIKVRSPVNGIKAVPNICKYSRDSLSIIAGCNDGSIMMWDTRRKFFSTSCCIKNAHLKGSELTGIDYCHGGDKICSRSEDETCKVWDLRQVKQPIATKTGLTTLHTTTDCCFSPDDKYVITGTSKTKADTGQLNFLDAVDLTLQQSVAADDSTSVLRVRWHPKINHIGYSCTNGQLVISYSNNKSIGGVLSASSKGVKRKKYQSSNTISNIKIITPHALPLFREEPSSVSFAKIRQDPKRSYKPEFPSASNENGRIKSHGSTLSSYIARNIALASKKDKDKEQSDKSE